MDINTVPRKHWRFTENFLGDGPHPFALHNATNWWWSCYIFNHKYLVLVTDLTEYEWKKDVWPPHITEAEYLHLVREYEIAMS